MVNLHPPNLPGTYALILRAVHPVSVMVGKAGQLEVRPGIYIYTGSAFGPGGLRARLARHLRKPLKLHWHIDYLRRVTVPLETWVVSGGENHEHAWARALLQLPYASLPMPGFGASDCRCPAHLIYLSNLPHPKILMEQLSGCIPAGSPLQRWLPDEILAGAPTHHESATITKPPSQLSLQPQQQSLHVDQQSLRSAQT
jgi:Uri superfamily endonuclease